jgi:hypothetical protein
LKRLCDLHFETGSASVADVPGKSRGSGAERAEDAETMATPRPQSTQRSSRLGGLYDEDA